MKTTKRNKPSALGIDEMRQSILRSGYALEQRIQPVFEDKGYFAELNPAFPDPETGKSREYDIRAISATRLYRKGTDFLFSVVLCECVNNTLPLVFFTRGSPIAFLHHEEIKLSGIPVKFWQQDGFTGFSEFVRMKDFSHYCKGTFATQYCTFQMKKDGSSWMAIHGTDHHLSFDALIKATEYEIDSHFRNWKPPEEPRLEPVNVQIYYPIVVVQGELYSALPTKHNVKLKKEKHIQFRKEIFTPRAAEPSTYQIDVICESHLSNYLTMVEAEMGKTKIFLQRRRAAVLDSVNRIVTDVLEQNKGSTFYREQLEF